MKNWVINEQKIIKNKKLNLNTITVNPSASLILDNVRLKMNSDIEVLENAELKIINSTIIGTGYNIYYYKGSKGFIDGSIIEGTKAGKDILNTTSFQKIALVKNILYF